MRLWAGERDPVKGADWLEAQVVYYKGSPASLEHLRSQITLEGDLDDKEDLSDHDLDQSEDVPSGPSERLVSNTAAEIHRRVALCGSAYPFTFNDGLLTWQNPGNLADPYIICLLAADREYYRPQDNTGKIFEHLTTMAVRSLLGGCAVRFGAPRDTMPKPFGEAILTLSKLTAATRLEGWETYPTDQDLGLDVVGWKKFSDNYNNLLQVFVQCATGEGWMEEKKGEPNIESWRGLLLWGLAPVTALAIPYVVNDAERWQRNLAGRLVLDRVRIATTLHGISLEGGPISWADWAQDRVAQATSNF